MPIVEKLLTSTIEQPVSIEIGHVLLKGDLVLPEDAFGLVLFAAGGGMSRSSSRCRRVVEAFEEQGLAALTFDLLSADEEAELPRNGKQECYVSMLAERLVEVTAWASDQRDLHRLPFGYFGAGTTAAAAMIASTERRGAVAAIVSRSGRMDLAGNTLPEVRPPTLLLVAANDQPMVRLNEAALMRLGSPRKELIMIPGASLRFEDPGELETVADLAADWFTRYLILLS